MDTEKRVFYKNYIISLVCYLLTLAVNYAGATGLINGMTQRDVSDKYLTFITPASLTFSIWGVIYGFLLLSFIVIFVKRRHYGIRQFARTVLPWLSLNFLLNALWIVLFSYQQLALSALTITGIMLSLIKINRLIQIGHFAKFRLFVITFGLYCGWLIIATIVNIAAWLVKIEWSGFAISAQRWTVFTLLLALVIIAFITYQLRNGYIALANGWAYYGIYLAHQQGQLQAFSTTSIKYGALIGCGLLIVLAVVMNYQYYRSPRYSQRY